MNEKWKEFYSDEDIKEIQKIELNSLNVFNRICNEIGVDYFLYGGSLLGAIKYKGFVPWDDDLDLGMLRADYEKFLSLAPALLPAKYEIQHPKINTKTPFPYIKFRRTDTELEDYVNSRISINHGVYFDIYPIDNMPDSEKKLNKQFKTVRLIIKLFLFRQNKYIRKEIKRKRDIITNALILLTHYVLCMVPHKVFVCLLDSTMTKYNDKPTKKQGNYFFHNATNYFDGILPPKIVEFEKMMLKIPNGYLVNLKNRYGDINELPPMDKRVGHKPYLLNLKWEDTDVN